MASPEEQREAQKVPAQRAWDAEREERNRVVIARHRAKGVALLREAVAPARKADRVVAEAWVQARETSARTGCPVDGTFWAEIARDEERVAAHVRRAIRLTMRAYDATARGV